MKQPLDYTQIRPAHTYRRMVPNVFNAASCDADLLKWFFRKISEDFVEAPSEGYIFLPRCYVFDGRYILDEGFTWVEQSLSDWEVTNDIKHWIIDNIKNNIGPAVNEGRDGWHTVMFMQCNSENYGHFLCESAPKLIHLAKMGCRKARIIFPKNCMKYCSFTQKFLAYLGIESEPLTLDEGSSVCLQNVLYFTAVSKHNFRKSETLLEFRDVALSLTAERGARSRKLFITRAEGDRRRLSNQEATAFCLAEIGYDAVYPGNLSVLEQIQLFAQASHIVGSVGAGMTNMLFCPAGADVFYICNGLLDFFFWDIAGLCRQKFHWFFAQPLKVFDQETFVRNFTVNIGGLMSALEFTQA